VLVMSSCSVHVIFVVIPRPQDRREFRIVAAPHHRMFVRAASIEVIDLLRTNSDSVPILTEEASSVTISTHMLTGTIFVTMGMMDHGS
jgi:tRNA(Phe) wybutosine-synthesizing methylase Tyw3